MEAPTFFRRPRVLLPSALSLAVSKLAAEHYLPKLRARTVMLRYVNIFGPRQRPDPAYAAGDPAFHRRGGDARMIHGDGNYSPPARAAVLLAATR